MKAIKILSCIACLLFATNMYAQKGHLKLNLQYSYAQPLGNFKSDIVSKSSPRGVTGDILYNINDKISVGLGLGYQDFYQKYPRALYETGHNETTSAVLSNSIQIIPVLAKAEISPLGDKFPVQPYISLGAGLGMVSFTQYLGEFGGTDNSGGLMLQGGAGIAIPFNSFHTSGLKLGADYNMVSYNRNGFKNFDNVSFKAGLFFPVR